eukprot:CAMPEP_0115346378 /NCGR_PEP_ID=MMETSP0270-20121206/94311_1 /TAXON_ID=71861 /ORGANISM="Scrippsiella trochoidea, Strain CCMP3099" /LENGTH=170 /DNA_ID=CAMNT_0002768221 /DNA_START=336 /DNA_END=845 /DNA_ORIENTATION=+
MGLEVLLVKLLSHLCPPLWGVPRMVAVIEGVRDAHLGSSHESPTSHQQKLSGAFRLQALIQSLMEEAFRAIEKVPEVIARGRALRDRLGIPHHRDHLRIVILYEASQVVDPLSTSQVLHALASSLAWDWIVLDANSPYPDTIDVLRVSFTHNLPLTGVRNYPLRPPSAKL